MALTVDGGSAGKRRQGDELAVVVVPAGPARDLRQLGVFQVAQLAPVELAQIREGHAVHVHVQPHADGVGGHHVVDLARLVQGDLGVARPRRQRAHDHRGAAPPGAQRSASSYTRSTENATTAVRGGRPRRVAFPPHDSATGAACVR
jgi:hypothetical protein